MPGQIRSTLFIDFENVALPPDDISSWLPWLEDGVFDHGKRRRFVLKRVYWNSSAERHEPAYKASGFEVIHCDRYVGLTNSVDIRMAIDIIESTYQFPRIDEYILVTRDSDFVPVLRRLRELHKRTAFLVDEKRPFVHTTYRSHADTLISAGGLSAARRYERPAPGFFGRLAGRFRRTTKVAASLERKPERNSAAAPASARPQRPPPKAPPLQAPVSEPHATSVVAPVAMTADQALAKALSLAIERARQNTGKLTAKSAMINALQAAPGFSTNGKNLFLGYGNYEALMRALASMDPQIEVVAQNSGGIAIRFVPRVEPAPAQDKGEPEGISAPLDPARPRPAAEARSTDQHPEPQPAKAVAV